MAGDEELLSLNIDPSGAVTGAGQIADAIGQIDAATQGAAGGLDALAAASAQFDAAAASVAGSAGEAAAGAEQMGEAAAGAGDATSGAGEAASGASGGFDALGATSQVASEGLSTVSASANSLGIDILAPVEGAKALVGVLGEAESGLGGFAIAAGLAALAVVGIAFAIAGEAIDDVVQFGLAIRDITNITGASAEAAGTFIFALEGVGISAETAARSLNYAERQIESIRNAMDQAAESAGGGGGGRNVAQEIADAYQQAGEQIADAQAKLVEQTLAAANARVVAEQDAADRIQEITDREAQALLDLAEKHTEAVDRINESIATLMEDYASSKEDRASSFQDALASLADHHATALANQAARESAAAARSAQSAADAAARKGEAIASANDSYNASLLSENDSFNAKMLLLDTELAAAKTDAARTTVQARITAEQLLHTQHLAKIETSHSEHLAKIESQYAAHLGRVSAATNNAGAQEEAHYAAAVAKATERHTKAEAKAKEHYEKKLKHLQDALVKEDEKYAEAEKKLEDRLARDIAKVEKNEEKKLAAIDARLKKEEALELAHIAKIDAALAKHLDKISESGGGGGGASKTPKETPFQSAFEKVMGAAVGPEAAAKAWDDLINRHVKFIDLLPQLMDGFQKLDEQQKASGDDMNLAGLAAELFGGRMGYKMLPFLKEGSAGLAEYNAAMKQAGIDPAKAEEAAMKYEKRMALLDIAILGVKYKIAEHLLPALMDFAAWATKYIDSHGPQIDKFLDEMGQRFRDIGAWFEEHWPAIKDALHDLGIWVADHTGDFERWGQAFVRVGEAFWNVGVMFYNIYTVFIKPIFDLLGAAFALLKGDWRLALHDMHEALSNFLGFDAIKIWDWMKNFADWVGTQMGRVASFFSDAWDAINRRAEEAWEVIRTFFEGDVKPFFIDTVVGWFKSLGSGISDVWDGVNRVAGTAWDVITDTVKAGVNGIIGLINSMINGINSFQIHIPGFDTHIPGVPSFGGFDWGGLHMPTIPYLASGMWEVPGQRGWGDSFAAMLSPGEMVIPPDTADKLRSGDGALAGRQQGDNVINMAGANITIYAYDRDQAQAAVTDFAAMLNSAIRAGGR
jgi:hypothetical protein